jgi:4-hydroxybenzoate polyprenyltransferase
MPLRALLELSRPRDWVKNVFVLMPLPFAVAAGARIEPLPFALGLLGLCLAGSAVYAFNDAQDAERDRAHPTKRSRPVASGRVSVTQARVWFAFLLVASAVLTLASGQRAALLVTGLYVALNLAYSLGAKHIPLVDVFLLASYYILRVVLGCALVGVVPSNWLLLCSTMLALFLALAKRRADIEAGIGAEHRPVLAGYNQGFLDQAMGIAAATTLISYSLYCMEAEVLTSSRKFASLPFVVFGVLEVLRLAHVRDEGGSPVDLLFRSPALIATGIGWLVAIWWSVQLP